MLTLIPETGAGVPGANSYVTLEYADAYFEGHPFYADAWSLIGQATKTVLLTSASNMLDAQYRWYGKRATLAQGLEWPRTGVRDMYDTPVPLYTVPPRLMQATAEQAYFLTKGDRSSESQTGAGLNRLKIDVIELEYGSNTSSTSSTQPVGSSVRGLLRGLGDYLGGMRVRRVVVG